MKGERGGAEGGVGIGGQDMDKCGESDYVRGMILCLCYCKTSLSLLQEKASEKNFDRNLWNV